MADFDLFYPKLKKNEGGYANNPDDRGGETWAGITRIFYADWAGWKIIDKAISEDRRLTSEELKQLEKLEKDFYLKEYWNHLKLNEVDDQELAEQICDFAVNAGTRVAIKTIQREINEEYNNYSGSELVVDGLIGSKTINAINSIAHLEWMVSDYKLARIEYYMGICKRNKSQKKFIYGWIKRVIEL